MLVQHQPTRWTACVIDGLWPGHSITGVCIGSAVHQQDMPVIYGYAGLYSLDHPRHCGCVPHVPLHPLAIRTYRIRALYWDCGSDHRYGCLVAQYLLLVGSV